MTEVDLFTDKAREIASKRTLHPRYEIVEASVGLLIVKTTQFTEKGDIGKRLFLNNHIPLWNDGSYIIIDKGSLNDGKKDVTIKWDRGTSDENEESQMVLAVSPYNMKQEKPGKDVSILSGSLVLKKKKNEPSHIMDLDILIREDFEYWGAHPGEDEKIYQKILSFYLKFFKFPTWNQEYKEKVKNMVASNFVVQEKFLKAIEGEFKIDSSNNLLVNYITDHCLSDPLELYKLYFETYNAEFPDIKISQEQK